MKILYLLITLVVSFALTEQVQAQHLNKQETQQLKKHFDKYLLKAISSATLQAESKVQRNNFSTLSDSIHTFSIFNEGDPYAQGINYHFTFDVVGGAAIITAINIKIFDPLFPVDNITATPTYDSQQRISKITMNTIFVGIPINVLNYYYTYDTVGNTTSIILESPGVLGGETTYEGDSVQFSYGTGNRVSELNTYYLAEGEWVFGYGISDITYDGNENIISVTQWYPGSDSLNTAPVPSFTLRDIEWYNNSMSSSFINPLGGNTSDVETELTGIEIAVADESYKLEPIAFIQSSYIDEVWVDSTLVRTYEQAAGRFTIFDAFYETGDFIYTQIHNYYYNGQDQLTSEEIVFDLGFGDPVPLDKIEYEHNEYGLIKAENFTFDQGQWISTDLATFDFVVVDGELHEYIETYVIGSDYESYKTVFFPSDVLETSVNETLLSEDVINVYPTLVKGNLTINFPQHSLAKDVKVSVWSLSGKLMLSQRFDTAAQNFEFNVSKLSSGLYFLNVQISEGMRTIRFVKE